MSNERNNQPQQANPANPQQQPQSPKEEDLEMNLNNNPRANENVGDTTGEALKGDGKGVGSEITDGEAG